MKKRVVAAGVIVALGVCWVGGAWYTSKQIEPNVEKFVSTFNKTNKQQSPQMGMTLSYKDFSNGLFSSHFKVVLTFDHGTEASGIKAGQNIAFDVDVAHGPFPLSSLAKGNLLPAMADVNVSPVNNELTKPLFDAAKGRSPINANIRVSYNKSATTQLVVAPASYTDKETTFAFEGGTVNISGDDSLLLCNARVNGQLNNVSITQKNNDFNLLSDSLTFNSNSHIAGPLLPVGNAEVTLNNIKIKVDDKEAVHIAAIRSKSDLALASDKRHANLSLEYGVDDFSKGAQHLGSGKVALLIDNIDMVAFRQFMLNYNQEMSQAIVANPALMNNEDAMVEKSTALMQKHLATLQKSEPVIKIPFSWKNEKGEITANINIAIADPAKATVTPESLTESLDRNVKTVSANVMLPLDTITNITKQVKITEGKDEASAQQQAEKAVKNFIMLGKMMDLITVDDKAATLDFQYKQGNVIFNGKEMTAEEFMARGGRFLR